MDAPIYWCYCNDVEGRLVEYNKSMDLHLTCALYFNLCDMQVLMAQESEAKESFGQLEMLQRTHDKLRSRADQLEAVHDGLFSKLEIVKKTLLVSKQEPALYAPSAFNLKAWVCLKYALR